MNKKPSEPGLYWVKTGRHEWWNGIAFVSGESPFLHVSSVYFPRNIVRNEMSMVNVLPDEISEWGEKIQDPNEGARYG